MAGAGKSTVGKVLARRLDWAFADGDHIIEAVYGVPLQTVTEAVDKETFLDILCNFPGDERILALGLALLRERPEKTALFASLLGKLGDPRAIPALQQALDAPGIHYLDYLELRNAVEALGGDVRCERDFSGDPYYESLRRME